jgi:hypothetical protein
MRPAGKIYNLLVITAEIPNGGIDLPKRNLHSSSVNLSLAFTSANPDESKETTEASAGPVETPGHPAFLCPTGVRQNGQTRYQTGAGRCLCRPERGE